VLLVMNERGMHHLLEDKFTLGADAAVAAGPVGRTAEANTDASLHAEILAWSRSRGVFAGIALNGAVLKADPDENEKLYGRAVTNHEVLRGDVRPPAGARILTAELDHYPATAGNADRSR